MQTGRAFLLHQALGPELNQCCGGAMTLAFEPFAPADHAWLRKLMRRGRRNRGRCSGAFASARPGTSGGLGSQGEGTEAEPDSSVARGEGRLTIRERVNPRPQALWLFGAGHVGQAVARALHPLGFAMTWIDGRAGELPDPPLAGVKQLALAMPELIVDEAPADTVFLVMTHSHPLDEAICDAVLRRGDFAYLGLIGSNTKRARFVKRLGGGRHSAQGARAPRLPDRPARDRKQGARGNRRLGRRRSSHAPRAQPPAPRRAPCSMSDETHRNFLRHAVRLSAERMREGAGGPFGAIIVKDGKVIAEGWNRVTSTNDPTAHAEVTAIRRACEELKDFSLKGCTIYTSCEPCPMCLSAIYWARLDRVYFASSREDAAAIGFDDALIYGEVSKPIADRIIPTINLPLPEADAVFAEWQAKPDKVKY